MEVVFTESSNLDISRVMLDRRNEDSGKKKPNEQERREKTGRRRLKRICEKRRTMEGATENGMMLCGPRVATHLSSFISS